MAQRTVVPKAFCFPVPEGVDDNTAAALPHPGVSAWLSLTARAKLTKGETVLILGATGVIGKLTVRVAKLLGAGRVIAAGRNEAVLSTLHDLGADATFKLNRSDLELTEVFARELGGGLHVIIDYLWGRPTEALLAAITRREFAAITSEMRPVQVGESAEQLFRFPPACYGVPRSLAGGGIMRCFSMVAPCVLSRVPELALVSFVAMIGPSFFDQAGQINTRSPPE